MPTARSRQLSSIGAAGFYFRTAGAAILPPLFAVWVGLGPVGVIGGTIVTTAGVFTMDRKNRRMASVNSVRRGNELTFPDALRADTDGNAAGAG